MYEDNYVRKQFNAISHSDIDTCRNAVDTYTNTIRFVSFNPHRFYYGSDRLF